MCAVSSNSGKRGPYLPSSADNSSALSNTDLEVNPTSPVVIGGVGGSGTRLLAQMLMQAGFFLGSDLNLEKDNLWFTLLFRRPRWYQRVANQKDRQVFIGLSLLTKAMLGGRSADFEELSFLTRAVAETSLSTGTTNKATRGLWPFLRARNILRGVTKGAAAQSHRGWGWKEPNSHIYLPFLSEHYSDLKYIHVIRHGLDLAFSRNQVQLSNWSFLFGLQRPRSAADVPALSLKYWIAANTRAFDLAKALGPERVLIVNFDRLCLAPAQEVSRILEFVGSSFSADDVRGLTVLPQTPASSDRYLRHDCSVFDRDDVDAVRRLGFEVKL